MEEKEKKPTRGKPPRRFEIVPDNLEYLDITKSTGRRGDSKHFKRYKTEIKGMRWSDLQEKLFTDGIPAGGYHFSIKTTDSPEVIQGRIKSIPVGVDLPKETSDKEISAIQRQINELHRTLKENVGKSDQLGIEFILNATKASHEAEIRFYEYQVKHKEEIITELRSDIKDLNKELDEAEKEFGKLQEQGGTGKYADAILGLVQQFSSKVSMPSKIKLNEKFDGSGIPGDIILLLDQVDYAQIPPEKLTGLKNGLGMLVQQLPQRVA